MSEKVTVEVRPVEPEEAAAELQQRLAAVQEKVRRLEEAKRVSSETLRFEVDI